MNVKRNRGWDFVIIDDFTGEDLQSIQIPIALASEIADAIKRFAEDAE